MMNFKIKNFFLKIKVYIGVGWRTTAEMDDRGSHSSSNEHRFETTSWTCGSRRGLCDYAWENPGSRTGWGESNSSCTRWKVVISFFGEYCRSKSGTEFKAYPWSRHIPFFSQKLWYDFSFSIAVLWNKSSFFFRSQSSHKKKKLYLLSKGKKRESRKLIKKKFKSFDKEKNASKVGGISISYQKCESCDITWVRASPLVD